jgi:putative endonuclease
MPVPERKGRKRRFGDFGERVAASHLEAKGYTILERNFHRPEGEIDLIASRGRNLVFIEVKSRSSRVMGTPEDAVVDPRKQAHIRAAAAVYIQEHPEAPPEHRIDVVAIELDHRGRVIRVEQVENAIEGD